MKMFSAGWSVVPRLDFFVALCVIALAAAPARTQADPGTPPEILWTQPVSGVPYTLACDAAGNVFAALGRLYSATEGTEGTALIKLSPEGQQLWSMPFPPGTYLRSACVDSSGNIVVLGNAFTDRFSIGTVHLNLLGAKSGFFIARFTGDGRVISARGAGGCFTAWRLALDRAGNAYVVGQFTHPFVRFCGAPVFYQKNRFFLAKFSRAGTFCWVRPLGSTLYGMGVDVSVDPLGNAYVAGTLQGSGLFAGKRVAGRTGCNLFVAKYNPAGRLLWLQQAGSTTNGASLAYTLAVDGTNGCYVCGTLAGQDMLMGDFTLQGDHSGISRGYDIFLARFNASGRVMWAKSAGGSGDDRPSVLGVAPNGDVLLPGSFTREAMFDSLILTNSCGPSRECQNAFLARYSRDGELRWVQSVVDPQRIAGFSTPVFSPTGHCYILAYGSAFSIARLTDWTETNAPPATPPVPPVPAE